ncbi:Sulfotransferase family protein [Prevotellaceae bacterium HUN156]|nr:Sulfotransferase family protein [Prevotellaceae bacterium HUN156]
MRLISCASYYGSGSSALTDLVAEYSTVKNLSDYEFRFVHDIDGIADLEYHLVDCHNRHNSGHALKRYKKLCEFNHGTGFIQRYEPYFNGQFLNISLDYIKELTDFEYKGKWFYDMYERGRWFYYAKSLQTKIYRRLNINRSSMPHEITLASHPTREQFLTATRKYIMRLMEAANVENNPILMMDQILPSSNINKCLKYFPEETKLIIVTRDPRDVYLSEKYVWHENIAPHDADLFCKWFDYAHSSNRDEVPDPQKVMQVNFEDLIYKYEEILPKLETFLGLKSEEHVHSFEGLNPKRSYGNTQLWKKFDDSANIAIIEKNLPQYLYDFGDKRYEDIAGVDVNNNKVF